jgi:L-asparaginase
MNLLVLETGGTINGILSPDAPAPAESRVIQWLQQRSDRLNLVLESRILVMKDSRAINDFDRALLAAAIEAAEQRHILVPHGTFTMPATGVYLREHLSAAAQDKTVVLTGSMIPLGEPDSDAPAALLFALDSLRLATSGVWVAMGGRVWHPADVVKDAHTGEYVARTDA